MKTRFDIEIDNSERICGGYLFTTEPMTKKQVAKVAEKLGRELLANDRCLNYVSYSCWEADNDDYENAAHVSVILSRRVRQRKILVTTY